MLVGHGIFMTVSSIAWTLKGDPEAPFLFLIAVFHFVLKFFMIKIPASIEYVLFMLAMMGIPIILELCIIEFPT